MPKYHILHDYTQLADSVLGEFTLHVAVGLTGNTHFPNPPVTAANLTLAANAFIAAVAKCVDGTTQDTIAKNVLRAALIADLDADVVYVELNSNNNPEVMASSNFRLANAHPVKPAPVGSVLLQAIVNEGSGSLHLILTLGPNVWGIEAQVSTAPGVWVPAGYFTDARNVTLTNLTPGTLYAVRVRVHGSFNQVSPWSDPLSHMCI